VVVGGIGLGVAGAGAAVVAGLTRGGATVRPALDLTGPVGTVPSAAPAPVTTERVYSAARGTEVGLITIVPEGMVPSGLPVCLALHGRGADAGWFLELGVPQFLTAAVRAGVRPFAVVAVDGGADSYWIDSHPGDPQRMLAEELPGWLVSRGFAGPPSAALGVSMGAFGALRYARSGGLRAVSVASPALFTSWGDARSRKVFRDERQWADNEPLRHVDALRGVPLGVWCGAEDPFADVAQELVDRANPEVAAIDSGAHDNDYWRRIFPDMFRFLGGHLN
jgi:S-formylglutathione hydrolase FrmB